MLLSRRARLLICFLLGLVVAAPLSSGDKGLWLSIGSAPLLMLEARGGPFPVEHSTLAAERRGHALTSVRAGRFDPGRGVAVLEAHGVLDLGQGWLRHEHRERSARAIAASAATPAAPRAPPV